MTHSAKISLVAAGAQRLREVPGQVEKMAGADSTVPAPALAAHSGAGGGAPEQQRRREEAVVVVGSGPAGLFAALTLAEAGLKVGGGRLHGGGSGHAAQVEGVGNTCARTFCSYC